MAVAFRVSVDSREAAANPDIVERLKGLGFEVAVKKLPVADYLVQDTYLVERKTALDFARSLGDGRLWSEVARMKLAAEVSGVDSLLVVEGSLALVKKFTSWNINSIIGACLAVASGWRIPVLTLPGKLWTASLLAACARRAASEKHGAPRLDVAAKKPAGDSEVLVAMLAAIPGIGPVHAAKILEKFGTLQALSQAAVEEIMQVEGVGRKRAEKIYSIFRARYGEEICKS